MDDCRKKDKEDEPDEKKGMMRTKKEARGKLNEKKERVRENVDNDKKGSFKNGNERVKERKGRERKEG